VYRNSLQGEKPAVDSVNFNCASGNPASAFVPRPALPPGMRIHGRCASRLDRPPGRLDWLQTILIRTSRNATLGSLAASLHTSPGANRRIRRNRRGAAYGHGRLSSKWSWALTPWTKRSASSFGSMRELQWALDWPTALNAGLWLTRSLARLAICFELRGEPGLPVGHFSRIPAASSSPVTCSTSGTSSATSSGDGMGC
jgi:hypothetical protein